MNLFYELFYKSYMENLNYPMPVPHWEIFNEALATFPTIDTPYPNITQSSRRTKKIQVIILHHSGSFDIAKSIKWFGNPNTYSSTNYLIDQDGYIVCLVPEKNAALHTPNSKYAHSRLVNEMSLGVTLIGDGMTEFTQAQYEAVAMLSSVWKEKYGLKIEDIKKHSEIECVPMVTDPSPWNQEKFLGLLDIYTNI
jgi:N-acetyl-anhydromuramyl-L-alanine amidase AmpD